MLIDCRKYSGFTLQRTRLAAANKNDMQPLKETSLHILTSVIKIIAKIISS